MKRILLIISIFALSNLVNSQNLVVDSIAVFEMNSSIRAIQAIDENTVWYAGSKGDFGYTENAGESWFVDSLKFDTIVPHFRSIAVTKKAIYLLSVATPALLYKSTNHGQSWSLVYKEEGEKVFYDAMKFWNKNEGIAMGDPTDGCLSIIITRNGGDSWEKISCDYLPPSVEGEAAFAASNSNIALVDDHAWIVSGGHAARVFHTANKGYQWEVFETPIVAGKTMTGIFSADFYDEDNGVIFGGNWEEKEDNTSNKAITSNGGKTWNLVSDGKEPGYRSCVKYVPGTKGQTLIAVGIPGISISYDAGNTWSLINDESWYVIDFDKEGNGWLAGNKKIGKLIWKNKKLR